MNTSIQAVIAAVQANGFKIIDDHCPKRSLETIDAIGIHHRGTREEVVALYGNVAYFSVNSIYLDDQGRPHLSTSSVGGVIKPFGDVQVGVDEYNEGQLKSPLTPCTIDGVVLRAA